MSVTPSRMLMVTAVLLAVVVAAELHFAPGEPESDMTSVSPPTAPADLLPAPSLVLVAPLEALTETVERPLFVPDRRPVVAEAPTAPAPAPVENVVSAPVSGIVLSAVVLTDEARLAFLRDPSSKQVLRLTVGDRLGEWTVEAIREDGVTLTSGARRESIPLRTFQPAPRAARTRAARRRASNRTARTSGQRQRRPASEATDEEDERPRRVRRPRAESE